MKSTQLLSVVFSLIMFTGVTAASAPVAFADSDDLEEKLEDFCEMTNDERLDFFSNNSDMTEYEQRLDSICTIENEDEREDALEELIDEIIPEARDDYDYDDQDTDHDEDDMDRDEDESYEDDDESMMMTDDMIVHLRKTMTKTKDMTILRIN